MGKRQHALLEGLAYRLQSAPIAIKVTAIFLPLFFLVGMVGGVGYVTINEVHTRLDEVVAAQRDQRASLDRFRIAHDASLVAFYRVALLLDASKSDEARAVANGSAKPKLEEAKAQLEALQAVEQQRLERKADATMQRVDRASRQIAIWLGLALAAGLVEVLLLVRFISGIIKPVKRLEKVVANLAVGDFNVSPEDHSGDEIGRLAQGFETMVGSMTDLVRQIATASETLHANSRSLAFAAQDSGEGASNVAVALGDLARGATRQVEEVIGGAERMNGISHAAGSLAMNVQLAADNVTLLSEAATEGQDALEQARQKMEQAERTVVGTANVVRRLSDMGKNIGQISDLIGSFAKKTNFLALNAGVEAARAGEEGRSFAVLATEIRKLALESGQAARRIADMVEHIQNETGDAIRAMDAGYEEVNVGVMALEDASFALERIALVIRESDTELREIAQSTRQVASSASAMALAMDSVAAICEQTAAGAEQVSAIAQHQNATGEELALSARILMQLAFDLRHVIRRFKVPVQALASPPIAALPVEAPAVVAEAPEAIPEVTESDWDTEVIEEGAGEPDDGFERPPGGQ